MALHLLPPESQPSRFLYYTCRGNTVGIIPDGSGVFHLGNVGPEAARPVMEGKAVITKTFGGVEAFPVAFPTVVARTAAETGVARKPLDPAEEQARARRIVYEGRPG